MAFTVTFAPKEEAFDFEKVQKFVEKICKKLQNEFNIELRADFMKLLYHTPR